MFRRVVFASPAIVSRCSSSASLLQVRAMGSKPGVSDAKSLKEFIAKAGSNLLVADVRNPDSEQEPGDQKSIAVGPLPSGGDVRPQAQLLTFNRSTKSMPLPDVPKDTPIITHCGGGGRGKRLRYFWRRTVSPMLLMVEDLKRQKIGISLVVNRRSMGR